MKGSGTSTENEAHFDFSGGRVEFSQRRLGTILLRQGLPISWPKDYQDDLRVIIYDYPSSEDLSEAEMSFALIDAAGPIVKTALASQLSGFDNNCPGSTRVGKC